MKRENFEEINDLGGAYLLTRKGSWEVCISTQSQSRLPESGDPCRIGLYYNEGTLDLIDEEEAPTLEEALMVAGQMLARCP